MYFVAVVLASFADALWACHAGGMRDKECVTSPKSVCVGGYSCFSID